LVDVMDRKQLKFEDEKIIANEVRRKRCFRICVDAGWTSNVYKILSYLGKFVHRVKALFL